MADGRGMRVALAGSHRPEPEGAAAVGKIDASKPIAVTLYLKNPSVKRDQPGSASDLAELMRTTTRRALARQRAVEYAPAAAAIRQFAEKNGLAVGACRLSRRYVVLKGTAGQMSEAFGATLHVYDDGKRRYRARSGPLLVPPDIARWTRAILGFDQRPQIKLKSLAGNGIGYGLSAREVADLYSIPRDNHGDGQCVGIIALGGGYLRSDLAEAAAAIGRPPPVVIDKSIDNATNSFNGGTPQDEEIALDLQVLAAIVPAAKFVVYFALNNTASLAAAIHQAVFDEVNRPQILSISWGSAEKFWTDSAREALQAALADAVRLKVTVTAAAGDFLATGGLSDQKAHVFFPASSPYVLACGGSEISLQAGGIASEVVWKEGFTGTGGGISDIFPIPDYQQRIAVPLSVNDGGTRRGVPDVAGAAARMPGYRIVLGGAPMVKDGTSAVAPLWAALVALANARRGFPLGMINPVLYSNPDVFRSITKGDNRVNGIGYDAAPGWNACTGLGAPKGADVIATLAAPLLA